MRPSEKNKRETKNNISTSDQTQLKQKHLQTLEDAMMEAKDREQWRAVVQDPIFLADKGQQYY